MLKLECTEVMGWEHAIRGMRNPMNSWNRSDSTWDYYFPSIEHELVQNGDNLNFYVGPRDRELMNKLHNAGTDHRKFMRMIIVYVDITAPLYWWKEFDTYKVGTVANSCSTMHKIHDKEFTLYDFSHEHLGDVSLEGLKKQIEYLNEVRAVYLKTSNKEWWWQMIQLLPTSYNQKRTVMLNYEVLANIYKSRKNHKLDEWHSFCGWIEEFMPLKELIVE